MLTPDAKTPPVTETPVTPDLLQTLEILTELVVKTVGQQLGESSIPLVLLSVEEPVGDLVLARVLHDGHDLLDFLFSQFSCPLADIDISFLADLGGETLAHPLDAGESKGDVPLAIDVGVKDTQDVLEFFWEYQSSHDFI